MFLFLLFYFVAFLGGGFIWFFDLLNSAIQKLSSLELIIDINVFFVKVTAWPLGPVLKEANGLLI